MIGEELFKKLSQRDYSGSDQDLYAQWLQTLHYNLILSGQENQFFEMLEKAEKENKKIIAAFLEAEEFFIDSLSLA